MTRLSHTLASALPVATAVALVSRALATARSSPLADLRYGKAFDAWVAKHRPATAVAAVRRNGEPYSSEVTTPIRARRR